MKRIRKINCLVAVTGLLSLLGGSIILLSRKKDTASAYADWSDNSVQAHDDSVISWTGGRYPTTYSCSYEYSYTNYCVLYYENNNPYLYYYFGLYFYPSLTVDGGSVTNSAENHSYQEFINSIPYENGKYFDYFDLTFTDITQTQIDQYFAELTFYFDFEIYDNDGNRAYYSAGETYTAIVPRARDLSLFANSTVTDLHGGRGLFAEPNKSYDGYTSGYTDGYDSGYSGGYNNGYNSGYQNGYADGSLNLQSQVEQAYSEGYTAGYDAGYSVDSTISTIFNGILQVGFVPVNFFLAIFNFEILGINLRSFIQAIFTVVITIIIIKMILGKSGGD